MTAEKKETGTAQDSSTVQHPTQKQPVEQIYEAQPPVTDQISDNVADLSIAEQYAALLRMPEEILLSWKGPSRPYKERNKQYYTTVAMIVFLLCIILFFAGNFVSIGVVLAFAFFVYVLASVPPDTVQYAITTHGLRVDDKLYQWGTIGRYWYTKRFHHTLLQVEYASRYVDRITFVLSDITEKQIDEILSQFLYKEKPLPTFMDKAATWLQKNIPLD